jgi:mannose-6-phosphate isomerase
MRNFNTDRKRFARYRFRIRRNWSRPLMPAIRLETKRVEKPWGRPDLGYGFDPVPAGAPPVGEIWFEAPDGSSPELLVKYLFTSDKLSIQVHPDDAQARERGYPRGKDESWVVLAADPHATIAIGTLDVMTDDELRAAALDGSIEDKVDWKAVRAGDFYYTPAGTIHAIGPGLTVVEVQQNVDLTYRLYDYGSGRELHLDDGVAVSNPVPYVATHIPMEAEAGRTVLSDGPAFVLERWSRSGEATLKAGTDRPVWLIPLAGAGTVDGTRLEAGGVWLVDGDAALSLEHDTDMLVAYPGAGVVRHIWG